MAESLIVPVVSVIMPLYDKAEEVGRAVESVLFQDFTDFELLVVNDGSTDNGPQIVRSFKDPRLRVIDQAHNGASAARNRGIREAKAQLIAFLDADDEWRPAFLETILTLKKKYPQSAVLATGYLFVDSDGAVRRPIIRGLPEQPRQGVLDDYFSIAAKSDPPLWTSALAVSKDAINSVELFPERITSGEDLLTWARLALRYPIAYDSSPLALFRQRSAAHEKPTRSPDHPDRVGMGLATLLAEAPMQKRKSLRKYLAYWHKNRASMYLRLGQRYRTLVELLKMGRYSLDRNFFLYSVAIFLPVRLLQKALLIRNRRIAELRRAAFPGKSDF